MISRLRSSSGRRSGRLTSFVRPLNMHYIKTITLLAILTSCTGPVWLRSKANNPNIRTQGHTGVANQKTVADFQIFGEIEPNSVQFIEQPPENLQIEYKPGEVTLHWIVPENRIGSYGKSPYFITGISRNHKFQIQIDCQPRWTILSRISIIP